MSAETSSADAAPADDPPAGSDRPSLVRFDYSRFSADELRLVTSPSALLSTFGVLRHLLPLRSNGCLVHPCATRSIRLDEVPEWSREQLEQAAADWAVHGFTPVGWFAVVTVGFYSHVVLILREAAGPLIVELTGTELHASGEAPRRVGAACFALFPGDRRVGSAALTLPPDPGLDEILRVLPRGSADELLSAARAAMSETGQAPLRLDPSELEDRLRALHVRRLESLVARRRLSPPARIELAVQTLTGLRLECGRPGRPCLRCGDLDASTLAPGHDGVCDRCLPGLLEDTRRRAFSLERWGVVISILGLGSVAFVVELARGAGAENLKLLAGLILGGALLGAGLMHFDQRVLRHQEWRRG